MTSKERKIYEKVLFGKAFDKDRFDCPQEIIDIIQFGQLLYEMATGCELKMICPDPNDYIFIPSPIARILKEIFPESDSSQERKSSLTLKSILETTGKIESFVSSKSFSSIGFLKPKIRIEEMLYDEFFRDESDPFYKNFMDLPRFQDQITKGILQQLKKLNYSNK